MLLGADWVISLSLGVIIRTGGECWLGGTSKNLDGQFCDSQMHFPESLNKNLKISPNHGGITDLRDLKGNSTNI